MYAISVNSKKNHMLVCMGGVLTLDEGIEIIKSLRLHPDFDPDLNRIFDCGDAFIDWSMDDINKLSLYIQNLLGQSKEHIKVAIVTSDSTEEAFMNLFVAIASHNLDRRFQMFSRLSDAEQWCA